jgi:hypothetical protein
MVGWFLIRKDTSAIRQKKGYYAIHDETVLEIT